MSAPPGWNAPPAAVVEAREGAERCPACGTPSGGRYCPGCGQRTGSVRLTFRAWLADFLDDNLSLNGTLPRSVGLLLTRPGFLTGEWLAGRRSPYTRPFRLYLIASAAFFAVAFAVGADTGTGRGAVEVWTHDPGDQVFFELWSAWLPTAMFFLVPGFALLLKGFFRGAGLYYVEHLVLGLHLHAAAFLILVPTWILELLPEPWLSISQTPFLLWIVAYAVLAFRRVYGAGWVGAVGKGLPLIFVYALTMVIATAGVAGVGILVGQERPLRQAHDRYFEYLDSLERGAEPGATSQALADAVRGYESVDVRILDAHDQYHMGRLDLERGRAVSAWSRATSSLREDSTGLLPLGLAARAAWELGAEAEAGRHAHGFLRALEATLDEEGGLSGRHVPEILDYRELARRIVAPPPG